MPRPYLHRLSFCLTFVAVAAVAAAQPRPAGQAGGPPAATHRAVATKVVEGPAVDGVLDDAAWAQAAAVDTFTQIEPAEGQPASERTEVRMIFTASTLYVGVQLFDSDPTKIVTTDSRRDSALSGQDSFQMIFDTYHDRQNGFIFGTNSLGIQ